MSYRIYFPCIHKGLTKNIAKICEKLGYTLLLPHASYKPKFRPPPPVKNFVWNEEITDTSSYNSPAVKLITKEELLDNPPDIIFIPNYESQFEILNNLWPKLRGKSKLAYYSGNVYWEGAYNWTAIKNYLAADSLALNLCEKYGVKNYAQFLPIIENNEQLTYTKDSFFGSYINDYENNFPNEHKFVKDFFDKYKEFNWLKCDNRKQEQIYKIMEESLATIHIKGTEGLGMSIIESLSLGRPIILHEDLSFIKGTNIPMTYQKWCIEGKSALYINSEQEMYEALKNLSQDDEYRYSMQKASYDICQEYFNKEKVLTTFKQFIENCR